MTKTVTHEPDPERKQFLTTRQLAAVLQVSESTVRRLSQQGRIPTVRLTPRILRFHLTAVRHALDSYSRNRSRNNTGDETPGDDAQLSFDDLI